MRGTECCTIPEKGIFFQGINVRVQGSDTVGMTIHGVANTRDGISKVCHIGIGGIQLRTVNRIFTGL